MTEYSRMAKGEFTAVGTSRVVNLPFQPDFVEIWNYTNIKTPATTKVTRAWWDANFVDPADSPPSNPTMVEGYGASATAASFNRIASNGISAFSAGQLLQFGPTLTVTDITKASPASVTTSGAHNLVSGDVVILEGLYQTSTTGMPQIDGIPFTITRTGATTFTIPWNTNQSNYTVISGAATGTPRVKKVLYPYLYFPGTSFISNITLGATTTIDTTDAHNFVVGQQVAFRIPQRWGTVELNSLPNLLTPGAPMYGYVIAVTDYNTVVVNINSSSYTAFNSNQDPLIVPGLSYPQIVAVGDVNTGGEPISAGSVLYPPPKYMPIGTTTFNTINGPAIRGAYVNNTSQGFVIGSGAADAPVTGSILTDGDLVIWRAFLHDMSVPV